MNALRIALVTLPLVLLAACGGDSLADRDPNGYAACTSLAEAFSHQDDFDSAMEHALAAGEAAAESTTPAIRDTVIGSALGMTAVDTEALVEVCRAEGVDMPDVPQRRA